MEISIEQVTRRVPVTVLRVIGNLDGASYQKFIETARAYYTAGARDFLIDLSETPYLSSAGLVALHTLVKLTRGEKLAEEESGWGALHDIEREASEKFEPHVKLLNLQPRVSRVLELAGILTFLPVFTDRETALGSF